MPLYSGGESPGRVIHFDNTDKDVMEYISQPPHRPLDHYPYSASAVRTDTEREGPARVYTSSAKAVPNCAASPPSYQGEPVFAENS